MAGQKLSGRASVVPIEPDIVFLALDTSPTLTFSIWKAGNLATPERFDTTAISNAFSTSDFLADCELSPDGTEVIYSRCGHNETPKRNSVRKVDWGDTTNVELYSDSGTTNGSSLQPTWNPAGTRILFRAQGSGATQCVIKEMDPDGTNVTTLYTSATSTNVVFNPVYNVDGTKIAWVEGTTGAGLTIHVMDNDGTNETTIYTPGGTVTINPYLAWANNSNMIAYTERPSSAYTANFIWKTINSDGTGNTTILTIDRSAGYGPSDIDPYPIKWIWLQDDTAVVSSRQIVPDADPDHVLTKIMADGSGYVDFSPERRLYYGTPDARPVLLGTRIYFPDTNANLTVLSSIKLDGTDYRTDFDGPSFTPDTVFHGFKGDTINI